MITQFPNLTGLIVNLEFTHTSEFNVMHEMAVDAFIRHLLQIGEQYSQYFSIITPENGRLHYRPNDPYRFVVLAQGNQKTLAPYWKNLINQLRQLPNSAPIKDKNVPLKNNVKLIGIQDYFDGIPVSNEKSLDAYTFTRASEQAQTWYKKLNIGKKTVTLQWHWQSTVRLLKKDHKTDKGEKRFCRNANQLTATLLLKRLSETLNNIAQTTISEKQQQHIQQQATKIDIIDADLYWVDTPYFGKNKKANTLGGMVGNFKLQLKPGVSESTLMLLILGQTVGFGQRRASGLGKYRLSYQKQAYHYDYGLQAVQVQRQQSLLSHMLQPHIISKAIALLEQKPKIDKLTAATHNQIKSAIGQITANTYTTPILKGFTIKKSDGEPRLLAITPLYDRVLQKAASLVLTPGLNAIMSQGSYGYRKGLSRQQVRYQIQNAYREGYKWVYESDIEDFFYAIDRQQLISRLQALFGNDPIWALISNWLSKDIHYKNTIIKRPKGIPQGSPLSPLLANFILDDLKSTTLTPLISAVKYTIILRKD